MSSLKLSKKLIKQTIKKRVNQTLANGTMKDEQPKRRQLFSYNGESMTRTEWAKKWNVDRSQALRWFKQEKTVENVLKRVANYHRTRLTHNNETKTFRAWANELGLYYAAFKARVDFFGEKDTDSIMDLSKKIPVKKPARRTKDLKSAAVKSGIPYDTLYYRIHTTGLSLEEAIQKRSSRNRT